MVTAMVPTGKEVLDRALLLMGYTNAYGEVDAAMDAELFKRGTMAVQAVYDDLQRIEHPGYMDPKPVVMDQPVPLGYVTVRDVMPYGVAMFLASSESNGDSQALFASLYNRKRASVPRPPDWRRNVIPRGGV